MFHRGRHKLPKEKAPTKPQSRLFIVAAMVGIVTIGLSVLAVLAIVNRYHEARLDNQRDTDRQITDLVCLVVDGHADGEGPLIGKLRATYKCPPYAAPPVSSVAPPAVTGSAAASRPPVPAATSKASTAPSRTVTAAAPTPAPAATVTAPRATVTTTAPAVPSLAPSLPAGGLVCVPALNVCL